MKDLLGEALVAACLVAGCFFAMTATLRRGVDGVVRREVRRLEKSVEPAIQKAHAAKDGIALQDAVQTFARIPDISAAGVIDKEDRFLAHSRLAQLGKSYEPPKNARDLWNVVLRDDQGRWGALIFSMSTAGERALWRHQALWGIGGGSGLWLAFIVWSFVMRKRLAVLRAALADRDALLSEAKAGHAQLEERFQNAQVLARSWVQSAVQKAPQKLLLLDERQRVVAANPQATHWLSGSEGISLLGKPWPDVPGLGACGSALERSLLSPEIGIQAANPLDSSILLLSTLKHGAGTWVTLFEPANVVK